MKKILFLSAWYPTRYDIMGGLFVKRHAELLTNDFNISALHAYAVKDFKNNFEIETLTESNIFTVRVYYKKVKTNIPGVSHLLKFWRFFKAYYIGLKEIRKHYGIPDLVHVNILTRVGLIAVCLNFFYKIPYVITEHWTRYTPERKTYKGFLRKILTRIVVYRSSGISAVSKNLKASMEECGIHHSYSLILNNIVDCDSFKPSGNLILNSKKIFSHISCFADEAKNVNGIIRSVAELSKQRSDFICQMVGDGPDWIKAVELADKLGIKDKTIMFAGILEGNALVELYNQSLFTLLFSNYENMPVVISESFSCGKPVIATSVGGIPEIVSESTGILVPPKDEEKLSNAIEFMLNHYQDYDPIHIRNYAIEQFGKASVLNQLRQLYQPIFANTQ